MRKQPGHPHQPAPARTARPGAALTLSPEQFAGLRDVLALFGGIYLDSAQHRVLEAGLASRVAALAMDLEHYEQLIRAPHGRDELRRLAELVLNHETFFFRNQPHLRALRDVILPEIHRRKPEGEPIRIWSAGCSTGEEPYSIAIAALEALGQSRQVIVYGTDLSEVALEKARAGFYRGRSLANVTPELLARYFEPRGGGHLVSGALRESVRFEQLNLLDPFPELLRGCDAIFCQNVTIYFQAETRRDLIARFYASLPPEGLLFLGFSETLWNVFDGFRSREVSGAYVYYKGEPEPPAAQRRAWSLPRRTQDETPQRLRPARAGHAAHQPGMGAQTRPAPAAQPAPRADDAATLAQSRALLDTGQVGQAIELLRHISPESALATQALTLVARAHADRGDLELAVAEIRRALEINTLNEEAYLLLGVIYARQGEWKTAVAELERARYLSPASPLVSFHLADAYRHAGRADQAAREYRSALRKLEPHAADTLLDGVAVGWLRATCERRLEGIAGGLGRR